MGLLDVFIFESAMVVCRSGFLSFLSAIGAGGLMGSACVVEGGSW